MFTECCSVMLVHMLIHCTVIPKNVAGKLIRLAVCNGECCLMEDKSALKWGLNAYAHALVSMFL